MTYYLTRVMHWSLESFDDLENLDIWKDAEEDPDLVEHHISVRHEHPWNFSMITSLSRSSKKACERVTIKESDNLEELIGYAAMLIL